MPKIYNMIFNSGITNLKIIGGHTGGLVTNRTSLRAAGINNNPSRNVLWCKAGINQSQPSHYDSMWHKVTKSNNVRFRVTFSIPIKKK